MSNREPKGPRMTTKTGGYIEIETKDTLHGTCHVVRRFARTGGRRLDSNFTVFQDEVVWVADQLLGGLLSEICGAPIGPDSRLESLRVCLQSRMEKVQP